MPCSHPPRQWDRRNIFQNPHPLLHRFYRTIFQRVFLLETELELTCEGAEDKTTKISRHHSSCVPFENFSIWVVYHSPQSQDGIAKVINLSTLSYTRPGLSSWMFRRGFKHILGGASLERHSENCAAALHFWCQWGLSAKKSSACLQMGCTPQMRRFTTSFIHCSPLK